MNEPSGDKTAVVAETVARERARTRRDVVIIVLLMAAVVAISAHAPSNMYAYAQRWQAGATLGMVSGGNWLLPRNQVYGLARKGPLYAWLDAPVLMLTGVYDDFTYRLPTVLAAVATALCVYVLGRWWYGRRVGLLAACLWASGAHMGKLVYLGTTDMLLTLWLTCSIMCVDRLVFHPVARGNRKWWACGLWLTMILGALTKGWGVVNLPLVAAMTALAAALGPGFEAREAANWPEDAHLLIVRLTLRRWWRAIKAVRLGWGLPAFLVVMGLALWGMFAEGGEEFRKLVYFELFQRATGTGEHAPVAPSAPPVVSLMYYALPAFLFAVGGLLLVRPSRWLTRKGPIYLPLCWVIAVVVLFSMSHGFAPHYLLPCYGGISLIGAWAIYTITARARRGGKLLPVLRHAFAAAPVVIGAGLVIVPTAYLLHAQLPEFLAKLLPIPAAVRPETWWLLGAAIILGVGVLVWGIRSSLRWRLDLVAFAACMGMVGVTFVYLHFASRHAQTGDGEKMRSFAQRAREVVGDDRVATYWTDSLCVRLYLGRLGPLLARPGAPKARPIEMHLAELAPNGVRWLITCDRGLVEMGQFREAAGGNYRVKVAGKVRTFRTLPELLSDEPVIASEPILAKYWGRLYLIKLKAGAKPHAMPLSLPYVSDDARRVEDVFQAARAALR